MTAPDGSHSLVDHARTELERLGEFVHAPAYAASLVATVAAFSSFGHSGASAMMAADVLGRLLAFDNLTPLTNDPAEWIDRTTMSGLGDGEIMWQSTRNSAAFSDDGARTFWLVTDQDGNPANPTAATRYPTTPAEDGSVPGYRQDPNPLPPPVDTFGPCSRTSQSGPFLVDPTGPGGVQ